LDPVTDPGDNLQDIDTNDPALELETLMAERDQLIDQLQRSVAEFQNFRRRTEADRFRMRELATQDVMRALLPIADDLQRAIANTPADQQGSALGEGIVAIERKFMGVLERNGVTTIGAVGELFDPAVHEAVATDDSGEQTHIVEMYQVGFRQGDTVLRPAMVKVGQPPVFHA